jgi:hypothetical protein
MFSDPRSLLPHAGDDRRLRSGSRALRCVTAAALLLAQGCIPKRPQAKDVLVPTLESVVEREGWTPTPTQSNIYRPGVILLPDTNGTHIVVANNCVEAEPDVQILSETRIASTLRAGVRGGGVGVSASAEGTIVKQLTFVDPEQRTIPLLDLEIKPECRDKLANAAKRYDIAEAIVVHDVLVAVIKNSTCTRIDAEGRVSVLGAAEASALTECVSESPGQVAVGYKAMPLRTVAMSVAAAGAAPASPAAASPPTTGAQGAPSRVATSGGSAAPLPAPVSSLPPRPSAPEPSLVLPPPERTTVVDDAPRPEVARLEAQAAAARRAEEQKAALRRCLLDKQAAFLAEATQEWSTLSRSSPTPLDLRGFVEGHTDVELVCSNEAGTRTLTVSAPEVALARSFAPAPPMAKPRPEEPIEAPPADQPGGARRGPRTLHQLDVESRPKTNDWSVGAVGLVNDPFQKQAGLTATTTLRVASAAGVHLGVLYFPDRGENAWRPLTRQLVEENNVSPDLSVLRYAVTAGLALEPVYLSGPRGAFSLGVRVGGAAVNTEDDLSALGAEDDPRAQITQLQRHGATYRQVYVDLSPSRDGWAIRLQSERLVFVETVNATALEVKNLMLLGAAFVIDGRAR